MQEGICDLKGLPFLSMLLMDTQRKTNTSWKHVSKLQEKKKLKTHVNSDWVCCFCEIQGTEKCLLISSSSI